MSDYPFMNSVMTSSAELPVFIEYTYDFNSETFIRDDGGNIKIVYRNDALKIWIYKALKTERYQYLAYSNDYGIELKPFIGLVMSVNERMSELKRIISECLLVNPYIKSIEKIEFINNGDKITANIDLKTIYGEVNINV